MMEKIFNLFNKNKKYNILILGSDGMLGYDVYNHFKTLSSKNNSNIGIVTGITKDDGIDVTKPYALSVFFKTSIHYDYCINCIAYTDTNKAENTSQGYNDSYALNALAPEFIASSCNAWKVKLIHISTDYVFSEFSTRNDLSTFEPYSILDSTPFPINVYGTHKLIGEYGIERSFKNRKKYCILRTSWLYSMHNNKSFIHKFMKNVVKACINASNDSTSKGPIAIEVVHSECSIPTSTRYVIDCIDHVIENEEYGILHAVPMLSSNEIVPSRFDFANEILKQFNNEVVNGINLNSVLIVNSTKEVINGHWPKFSAMKSSFSWTASWKAYLNSFIIQNKKAILEYALKLAITEDGCLFGLKSIKENTK